MTTALRATLRELLAEHEAKPPQLCDEWADGYAPEIAYAAVNALPELLDALDAGEKRIADMEANTVNAMEWQHEKSRAEEAERELARASEAATTNNLALRETRELLEKAERELAELMNQLQTERLGAKALATESKESPNDDATELG